MANYLAIAVNLLAVFEAILLWHGAVAQNSGPQVAALEAFGSRGNPTYVNVNSCATQGSTNLTCSTMNLVVNRASGVSLQTVNYGLCLCGSAVAVVYSLSNGMEVVHSCQQCPFEVKIGQLQIRHNVKVFVNDSGNTNTTIIRFSVDVFGISSAAVGLFGSYDIPLTQQSGGDCQNITRPPEMCSPLTTEPPPRPITTSTAATNNRGVVIGVSVAIVFAVIVIIVIIAAIILIACFWQEIHNTWMEVKGRKDPDGHKGIKDPK